MSDAISGEVIEAPDFEVVKQEMITEAEAEKVAFAAAIAASDAMQATQVKAQAVIAYSKNDILAGLALAIEEAGPPPDDFVAAAQLEARSLAKWQGGMPDPNARGAATLPARRGNHRRGPLRGANDGKNTPAPEDPIVLRRRAIAMPLWNKGYTANDILSVVNDYLKSEGLQSVAIQTIRNDRDAIVKSWQEDYDKASAVNRQQHIASLQRIKREAMEQYEKCAVVAAATTAAVQFLKTALQAEVALANIDGSQKLSNLQAEGANSRDQEGKVTRVYVGVDVSKI